MTLWDSAAHRVQHSVRGSLSLEGTPSLPQCFSWTTFLGRERARRSQDSFLHSQCNHPGESSIPMNSSRPHLRWMGYNGSGWKDLPYHLLLSTIIVTDTSLTLFRIWEPFLLIISFGALAESVGQGHLTFCYRGVVTLDKMPELPTWAAVLTSDGCYSKLPHAWGLRTMQMHSLTTLEPQVSFMRLNFKVLTGQRRLQGIIHFLEFSSFQGPPASLGSDLLLTSLQTLVSSLTSASCPISCPPLIRTHVMETPSKFLQIVSQVLMQLRNSQQHICPWLRALFGGGSCLL